MTNTGPFENRRRNLIESVAARICEAGNVPGFVCTCPQMQEEEGNRWCNGERVMWQARVAVREVLKFLEREGNWKVCNYLSDELYAARPKEWSSKRGTMG